MKQKKIPPEGEPTAPIPEPSATTEQEQTAVDADASEVEKIPTPPEPETAPIAGPTPEEISGMLAEAEQRGYLRGRNEKIEELMRAPAMMEPPAGIRPDTPPLEAVPETEFLSRHRISIWDM